MTTTMPSQDPSTPRSAPGGEAGPPSPPHLRLVMLPTSRLLSGVVAASAVVASLGWLAARFLRPASMDAVLLGGPPTAVVVCLGILMVNPWKPRKVVEWPMVMFGVQGATLFGAGVVAAVIFSQTRPEPIGFGAALMATFVGSWVVVAKVLRRALAVPR